MNPQFNLKNHVLLMAIAAAYPAVGFAAGAARVEFASGPVVAITPAGAQRGLSRGAELQSGEAVRTGDNARLQLRFSDGAMMSLQPQTEFRIDDYRYNGKADGEERGFFSLIKGGLRTITGLVGRSNRDNYKVTTSVATIGIRGTEYSAVITNKGSGSESELNVSTGEGRVEVCNAGGCVIVAGGQSAVVTGTTPAVVSPIKSVSSSSTSGSTTSTNVTSTPLAPYSVVENVNSDGTPAVVPSGLPSGPGYSLAYAENQSGLLYGGVFDAVTATFGSGSKLANFTDGSDTHTAGTITGAFSIDGIIGWGIWSSGTGGVGGGIPLTDFHYVVGKPTNVADLQSLGSQNMQGTYTLAGYTTPTSTMGNGSNFNATLTANFGSTYTTVDANISMNIGADSVSAVTSMSTSAGASFGGGGTVTVNGSTSSGISMHGFFAGANASHAGLTYKIENINLGGNTGGNDSINGSAVFKQSSLVQGMPP